MRITLWVLFASVLGSGVPGCKEEPRAVVPVAYSAPPTVQQEPTPAAPETKPEGLGGIEVSGSVKIWGGKILYRAEFGGGIAIDPACCCGEGGPCECTTECLDGYGVRTLIPEEHEAHVNMEYGPACSGGGYWHTIAVIEGSGPYTTFYHIELSMTCEVVGETAVWTITQSAYDWVWIEGVEYAAYTATNTQVLPCNKDGVPSPGTVDEWDIASKIPPWGDMAPGFPLDVEIFQNPFP